MLPRPDIYRLVNGYIGVEAGYLGDFSYRTHAEFYPAYCDLDINPNEYEGTTRQRFIEILQSQPPHNQARIIRGIFAKYPVSSFPEDKRPHKQELQDSLMKTVAVLEGQAVESPDLQITSATVSRAIADAEALLQKSGASSGVDRMHTALHGYLKAVCDAQGITYDGNPTLTQLWKLLRENHPALKPTGPRQEDIDKVLRTLSTVLDVLNPIRNQASVAHPNEDLLAEDEALLVINATRTILQYLNRKLGKQQKSKGSR